MFGFGNGLTKLFSVEIPNASSCKVKIDFPGESFVSNFLKIIIHRLMIEVDEFLTRQVGSVIRFNF